jgi:hypothetical protein
MCHDSFSIDEFKGFRSWLLEADNIIHEDNRNDDESAPKATDIEFSQGNKLQKPGVLGEIETTSQNLDIVLKNKEVMHQLIEWSSSSTSKLIIEHNTQLL